MTSEEILKRSRRKRKEFLPGPEPRYDQWPIDGDWLSTYPFPLFLNEAHILLDARLNSRGHKTKRGSLEYYLQPLKGTSLPGKEELIRHVQEKHRRNFRANTLRGTVAIGRKQFLRFLQKIFCAP